MLVGFGQTICKNSPNCGECDVSHLCPSADKRKIKKKKKQEKLEALAQAEQDEIND